MRPFKDASGLIGIPIDNFTRNPQLSKRYFPFAICSHSISCVQMQEMAKIILNEAEAIRKEAGRSESDKSASMKRNWSLFGKIKEFFANTMDDKDISSDTKLEEKLFAVYNQLAAIFNVGDILIIVIHSFYKVINHCSAMEGDSIIYNAESVILRRCFVC